MVTQMIKLADLKEVERIIKKQFIHLVNETKLNEDIINKFTQNHDIIDSLEIHKELGNQKKRKMVRLIKRLRKIERIKIQLRKEIILNNVHKISCLQG